MMDNLVISLPHASNRAHVILILFTIVALVATMIALVRSLRSGKTVRRQINEISSPVVKHDLQILFYIKNPILIWGLLFALLSIGLWMIMKEGFVAINCTPTHIQLDYRIFPDISYEWIDVRDIQATRTGKFGRNVAIEIVTSDGNSFRSVVANRRREGTTFEQAYLKIEEFRNTRGK